MVNKIKLPNQTLENVPAEYFVLNPDTIAQKSEAEAKTERDSKLKRWLSQVTPMATNAELVWTEEKNGDTTVEVKPKLGTKGSGARDELLATLNNLPSTKLPTYITFAQTLYQQAEQGIFQGEGALERLRALRPSIEAALHEYEETATHRHALYGKGISDILRAFSQAQAAPIAWFV